MFLCSVQKPLLSFFFWVWLTLLQVILSTYSSKQCREAAICSFCPSTAQLCRRLSSPSKLHCAKVNAGSLLSPTALPHLLLGIESPKMAVPNAFHDMLGNLRRVRSLAQPVPPTHTSGPSQELHAETVADLAEGLPEALAQSSQTVPLLEKVVELSEKIQSHKTYEQVDLEEARSLREKLRDIRGPSAQLKEQVGMVKKVGHPAGRLVLFSLAEDLGI